MTTDRSERIRRHFEQFGGVVAGESELYRRLSEGALQDPYLLELAARAAENQPPVNMLLSAVHFLLLRGADHELARFYPTVSAAKPPPDDPFPAFADFCRRFRDDVIPLLESGRVQTNEVRRAALLLPAFEEAARRSERKLATVEVGTAAGLLTLWDRYGYDYGEAGRVGPSEPALMLHTESRGAALPLGMPHRAWSAGIDLNPVNVSDADQADWLRSLVWPDQLQRMERLEAAIGVARADPPNLVRGDGLEILSGVVNQAPADAVVVVHHSFTLNQVPKENRQRFLDTVAELGADRPLFLVGIDWHKPDLGYRLVLGSPSDGQLDIEVLARVHHHGEWIEWGVESSGT